MTKIKSWPELRADNACPRYWRDHLLKNPKPSVKRPKCVVTHHTENIDLGVQEVPKKRSDGVWWAVIAVCVVYMAVVFGPYVVNQLFK